MKFHKIIIILSTIFISTLRGQSDTINISWNYVSGWAGSCAYVINGENNPIIYLERGQNYLFNINTFGHPVIIDGIIDTIDEGSFSISISDEFSDTLNYRCLYSCEHPNEQNHNCWMTDPFHDFDAGNLVIIQQKPTYISSDLFSYSYNILQNYPNPFNPITIINYEIPSYDFVELIVFDILGRNINNLVKQYQNVGKYEVEFNGSNLSSGIYLYTLKVGKNIQTRKMILSK